MASESGRSERDGSTTAIIMSCGERTSERADRSSAPTRRVQDPNFSRQGRAKANVMLGVYFVLQDLPQIPAVSTPPGPQKIEV